MHLVEPAQTQAPPHLDRRQYDGFEAALMDADRVAADLLASLGEQVVVPTSDIEFLARRLRDLVVACQLALQDQELQR